MGPSSLGMLTTFIRTLRVSSWQDVLQRSGAYHRPCDPYSHLPALAQHEALLLFLTTYCGTGSDNEQGCAHWKGSAHPTAVRRYPDRDQGLGLVTSASDGGWEGLLTSFDAFRPSNLRHVK